MKSLLAKSYGLPGSLEFAEIPDPVAGPDDVVIRVQACSVSFPDLLMIQGKYQVKPPLPFSPGGEAAGIVTAVGANVKELKSGDVVMALSGWGGLAEKLAVSARRVFKLGAGIDPVAGASTFYTYGTSYHALKDRAKLQPGETLLVLGAAGGVGLAAVELGRIMGARVIAAASSPDKLKICESKGASHVIDYSKEDIRERIKSIAENGVDVVFDPVGGSLSDGSLRSMAWGGRYLVVGFASGVIPQFPANIPLLKGCSIVGVFWGGFSEREPAHNRENLAALSAMATRGEIRQHVHKTYSFDQARLALLELQDRKVIGKAVVKISL